jgi:hypothetical protein
MSVTHHRQNPLEFICKTEVIAYVNGEMEETGVGDVAYYKILVRLISEDHFVEI